MCYLRQLQTGRKGVACYDFHLPKYFYDKIKCKEVRFWSKWHNILADVEYSFIHYSPFSGFKHMFVFKKNKITKIVIKICSQDLVKMVAILIIKTSQVRDASYKKLFIIFIHFLYKCCVFLVMFCVSIDGTAGQKMIR